MDSKSRALMIYQPRFLDSKVQEVALQARLIY